MADQPNEWQAGWQERLSRLRQKLRAHTAAKNTPSMANRVTPEDIKDVENQVEPTDIISEKLITGESKPKLG